MDDAWLEDVFTVIRNDPTFEIISNDWSLAFNDEIFTLQLLVGVEASSVDRK